MSDNPDFKVTSSWTGQLPTVSSPSPATREHSTAVRLITHPVVALLGIALVVWSVIEVPESLLVEPVGYLFRAIEPMSVIKPTGDGNWAVDQLLLFAVAAGITLAVVAYTPLRRVTFLPLALSVAASGPLAFRVVNQLSSLPDSMPSIAIGLIAGALIVRGAMLLPLTGEPTGPKISIAAPVLLTLSGVVPLAIGRSVANGSPTALELEQLATDVTARWQAALGTCVLFAGWALLSLLPPYRGRSVSIPVVVLIGSVLIGFGYVLPQLAGP